MQTKAIKQKMKSVASIKKITKTMEMVSVAKMKKAVAKASLGRSYFISVLELLQHLSKENFRHPFFVRPKGNRHLVLVIAGSKGLCGSYNVNIMKSLTKLKEKYGDKIDCLTIGRHAERMTARLSLNILASFIQFTGEVSLEEIYNLKEIIMKEFKTGRYQSVLVLYTEFIRSSKWLPTTKQLLPIQENALQDIFSEEILKKVPAKNQLALYLFEPSEGVILDQVVPNLILTALRQILIESQAAEHSSRMFAMKAASDNATELLDDLSLSYNYARQDGITRELSEIVGGAAALQTS